jgi:hypothetical protein
MASAKDADGDFAAIGDQDFFKSSYLDFSRAWFK